MSKSASRRLLLCTVLSLTATLTGWTQSDPAAQPATKAATALPSGWTQFDVRGFKVQTPFPLKKLPMPPLNADVLKAIAFMEAYQGASAQLVVMANITEYQPGIVGKLDDAVKGAANGIARAIGQATPEYTSRELTISGHPARDVTVTISANDPVTGVPSTMTCRMVIVLAGTRLGQVVVMQLKGDSTSDITKILDSISMAAN